MPKGPSDQPPPNAIVAQIPDHELIRPIGGGSYGEVWLARNVMGTYRAVKVVYRSTFDSERPFEREFAGIQKFEPVSRSHDGLVDILQIGRNDPSGYFYYVMELADDASGEREQGRKGAVEIFSLSPSLSFSPAQYSPHTLASEIAVCGRLPYDQCLPLFLSLASALAHLHKHGLIHRDIKPSNIIFVKGLAKLADIGLVTEAGEATSYVGTEGYIPPEGPGTRQADIFSLGKLFYELSTGLDRTKFPSLPIEADDLAANKGLLELNAIFVKACAADVKQRYQTADEMHADLALLQSGKSVKRMRTIERRLVQATRLGVVITVLLTLVLVAYFFSEWQRRIARENFDRAEAQRLRAERAEQDLRKKAEDTEKLWSTYLSQLQAGRLTGQRRQRLDRLKALAQAAADRPSVELRNEAIAALTLTDLRPLHTIQPKGKTPLWLDFDASLERCLALDDRGELHIYRTSDVVDTKTDATELTRLTGVARGPVLSVIWSRDGRFVGVILKSRQFQVWDLEKQQLAFEQPAQADAHLWSFTPDSQSLVVGYANHELTFRQVHTGRTNHVLVLNTHPRHFSFSPDGRQFAMVNEPTDTVEIRSCEQGELIQLWRHPCPVRELDWSHDGQQLATAGHDQNLYVWDCAGGQLVQTLRGHGSVVTHVSFLAGDDLLASCGWDGTFRLWDPRTGRQVLNAPGLAYHSFEFNPATKRLGVQTADVSHMEPFTPSRLKIYELMRSDVARELCERRIPDWNGPWCVAFSPDERWLASGSKDGVRLWDVATGRQLAHLPGTLTGSVFFDPAGESLITCSEDKLLRWPVAGESQELVLGPPRVLAPPQARTFVAASLTPQGDLFATVKGGRIRGFRGGTNTLFLSRSDNSFHLTTSSDGQWLAAGFGRQPGAALFSVADGRLARTLPTAGSAEVAFTPDNRWLVTGAFDEYCFWDVSTGQRGLRIAREQDPGLTGRIAFTPDGKLMAIARSQWVVSLIDPVNGQELARLEHPNAQLVSALTFSPSGAQLAVATEGHAIQLWDLRKLRAELAALNLDWNQPPFTPENSSKGLPPLQVKIVTAPSAPPR
jgi:WD40 repeat protein